MKEKQVERRELPPLPYTVKMGLRTRRVKASVVKEITREAGQVIGERTISAIVTHYFKEEKGDAPKPKPIPEEEAETYRRAAAALFKIDPVHVKVNFVASPENKSRTGLLRWLFGGFAEDMRRARAEGRAEKEREQEIWEAEKRRKGGQ